MKANEIIALCWMVWGISMAIAVQITSRTTLIAIWAIFALLMIAGRYVYLFYEKGEVNESPTV